MEKAGSRLGCEGTVEHGGSTDSHQIVVNVAKANEILTGTFPYEGKLKELFSCRLEEQCKIADL